MMQRIAVTLINKKYNPHSTTSSRAWVISNTTTISSRNRYISSKSISSDYEKRYRSIIESKPWSELLSTYCFYSLLSFQPLQWCVSQSKTIYTRFCGGQTLTDCLPLLERLSSSSSQSQQGEGGGGRVDFMLDESKEQSEDLELNTKEICGKLPAFAKLGCSFVPLKLTAYIAERVLREISLSISPLTGNESNVLEDEEILRIAFQRGESSSNDSERLYQEGMRRLSLILQETQRLQQEALKEGQRTLSILLDAEQSDLQPAVELIYRQLALQFNQLPPNTNTTTTITTATNNTSTTTYNKLASTFSNKPLVYSTYQCYLTRTPLAIERDLQHAIKHNLHFGVKLVRGAYLSTESKRPLSDRNHACIHPSKALVDSCYNSMADKLLDLMHQSSTTSHPISIVFATHNAPSVIHILQSIDQRGLSTIHTSSQSSIHFAQILGMSDYLTETIAVILKEKEMKTSSVCKLVLYGEFDYLIMWLIRRWEENQNGESAMQQEKTLLWSVIKSKAKSLLK